jgi:predicted nucleic acid-binding protein
MTVLVDSDILIEVSRGLNQSIVSGWRELAGSDALVAYSPVSVAELWAGVRPGEQDRLTALFDSLLWVTIDPGTGRQAELPE